MRAKISDIVIISVLTLISAIFLFPLLVTVTNSFMPSSEIITNYTSKLSIFDVLNGIAKKFINIKLLPGTLTASQYKEVLIDQPSYLLLMINSLKITVPVVIGNVLVSLLSAYGFTIWRWKYKEAVFLVYIIVMLMPLQAVLVPNYIVADMLGIKDSYLAIILPGIFSPFGTFLLRQTMKAVPYEYFEAAKMDGDNDFKILLNIIIPQMKSGLAALAMLVFIEYWNIVEQVVIFVKDYYKEPLSVFLSRISQDNISIVFAASCVYMFLPFYFLMIGQKNLEKGIELSGIK